MNSIERTTTVRELVPLLFVENIGRSLTFYLDLGFELAGTWEPGGNLSWCRLQRDSSALMLQQATDEDGPAKGRGRGIEFFFICDDADAFHSELRRKGMELPSPQTAFYAMKQVFLRDPDGYKLCFESPVATPNN